MANLKKEVMQMKDLTVEDEENRLFKAWVSVEMVDRQGEIIPIDEMAKVMTKWMRRNAPLIDSHSNRVIGRGLNWEKTEKEGKPAILITGEIYKDQSLDNEVWEKVKSGEITGLSYGGRSHSAELITGGKEPVRSLRDLEVYEISLVETPANPEALMEEINFIAKGDGSMLTCQLCGDKIKEVDDATEHSFKHTYPKEDFKKYKFMLMEKETKKSEEEFTKEMEKIGSIMEATKQNNPWAICTASVGRENKDKFERCVMDLKHKMGLKAEDNEHTEEQTKTEEIATKQEEQKPIETEKEEVKKAISKEELENFVKSLIEKTQEQRKRNKKKSVRNRLDAFSRRKRPFPYGKM